MGKGGRENRSSTGGRIGGRGRKGRDEWSKDDEKEGGREER
jgi:hypothetical protein